ncbi:pseudouridine synthase [Caldimonas brevitalea]|uniref:tRNA pseudouridine synthase C n=1 Tax=Caldimonas brevitalea TaxID=413882 RepID=A0A0G3BKV6_9BURK|nr:pseudouridine synthase [Caldimonas brevitalea]AKJ30032.1 tRNA pseudouridine65 synthase [Caldimonas brevitalea]
MATIVDAPADAGPPTLPVLHLDDRLVAVHKPAGLLVHRTPLARRDEHFALQCVRDQLGGAHVYPVHRLDRGTSGVLLFARDPATARQLTQQFESQAVHKRYLAFVRGWPAPQGEIDHALSRLEEDRPDTSRGVSTEAQPALTRFRRLATLEVDAALGPHPTSRYAALQVEPETGRQHQIRRHLKHISHPIVGDATYGKGVHNRWWAQRLGLQRLWLHAWSIEFAHPDSGSTLRVQAPPGPEWERLWAEPRWRWEAPLATA